MGREHPPETVYRAQELYCVDRMSFAQVAKAVGVAESSLKRWSVTFDWQAKRNEIAQAEADIRADFILGRSKMLKTLIKSTDAQVGFAVASLETLAMRQAEAIRQGKLLDAASGAKPQRPIRTREDAILAVREAIERRLQQLVGMPDLVDLRSLQDVQRCLGLLETLERSVAPGLESEAASKVLPADVTQALREALGLKA
jgi:transposase-like protein